MVHTEHVLVAPCPLNVVQMPARTRGRVPRFHPGILRRFKKASCLPGTLVAYQRGQRPSKRPTKNGNIDSPPTDPNITRSSPVVWTRPHEVRPAGYEVTPLPGA